MGVRKIFHHVHEQSLAFYCYSRPWLSTETEGSFSEWGKDMIFGFPHEWLSSTAEDIKTVTSLREGCNWVTDLACLTNGPQDSESADTLMAHPDPVLAETPWYSREE